VLPVGVLAQRGDVRPSGQLDYLDCRLIKSGSWITIPDRIQGIKNQTKSVTVTVKNWKAKNVTEMFFLNKNILPLFISFTFISLHFLPSGFVTLTLQTAVPVFFVQ